MKRQILTATLALSFLAGAPALANNDNTSQQQEMTKMDITKNSETEPKQGPAENFTGTVMVDSSFASKQNDSYNGAMVNFEAGARTNWHAHPEGQTLIITSGEGRAQVEGEPVKKLEKGDVVWFPADVKHWHGAAPNSPMSHVAIVEANAEGTATNWMEPVSDEQFTAEAE